MSETLAFSPAAKKQIAEFVRRYPRKQGALIPVLYIAQDQFGYLPPNVLQLVAAELELPLASVLSTAMFYTMLHKTPVGRYQVQICTNVSCYLLGSDDLAAAAKEELGVDFGETTDDGLFSLESVQCLCACDKAPCLQINKDDKFNVTPDQLRQTIRDLRDSVNSEPAQGGAHA